MVKQNNKSSYSAGLHRKFKRRSIIGKWANLRDNWLRYWRKRQELIRVGSSTKTLKKYIHHDQLLFLSKVYDPEGQQEVEEIQVEVDVISDPEFESTVEFDEISQHSWNTPQYLPTPLPTQDQSERHLYFFHSILPMICDFDDDQILEFHTGVLDWVKRVKHREFINVQKCHPSCNQRIQESNVNRGDFYQNKSEATAKSNCLCNSTQQILVKKEPTNDFFHKISDSEVTESTHTSNLSIGICNFTDNEVKQKLSCDKSEFLCLNNVVTKLEKISETIEARVNDNSLGQLGQSFASLLTQLSPKKIQSLKRKIVKEVVREELKKIKIDSTRSNETDKADEFSYSEHITDPCDIYSDNTVELSTSSDKEATSSILRDTLKQFTASL